MQYFSKSHVVILPSKVTEISAKEKKEKKEKPKKPTIHPMTVKQCKSMEVEQLIVLCRSCHDSISSS